ncbi:MAG: YggT family protein [Lentisphaerae bacterium]|nr:YggT family protein [Lentisphaerota bacterium]
MQFTFWDNLFNVFLLVLWFRIWTDNDRSLQFNSTIASLGRLSNIVVDFVKPVMFGLPPRLVAGVCILFLVLFRAVLFHGMSGGSGMAWALPFGFEGHVSTGTTFRGVLLFSTLSFAIFLFKVWGFSLIYVHGRVEPSNHSANALYQVSRPFSAIPMKLRPAVYLGYGVLIALALRMGAAHTVGLAGTQVSPGSPVMAAFLQMCISVLAEWAGLLVLVRFLVIVCIVGSWAAMFGSSGGLGALCHGWLGFLMGPLRRFPIRIGMFDLTPLIFLIALPIVHRLLIDILKASLQQLL